MHPVSARYQQSSGVLCIDSDRRTIAGMTSITVMGPLKVEDSGLALAPRDRVVLSVLVTRTDASATGQAGSEECPDPARLRGQAATVPEAWRATVTLAWTAEALTGATDDNYESAFGGPLDERSVEELVFLGQALAGTIGASPHPVPLSPRAAAKTTCCGRPGPWS